MLASQVNKCVLHMWCGVESEEKKMFSVMLKNHSEMQIQKDANEVFSVTNPTFRENLKKFEKCKCVLMQMLADVLN